MFSPIGFREFNEDEYRKFIRTLSEEELIKAASGDLVYNVPVRMLVDESVFNMPFGFDSHTLPPVSIE
jgi:hypothetical protein